jgi:chloramphenicol-sensitive protein RarD
VKYYLSAITGFAIWGTFAFVLKPLSSFSSLDILIHRVIYASICILIACFLFRRKQVLESVQYVKTLTLTDRRKLLYNILFSAITLAANWFLFIYVMNKVSINATSLAYLICPILTTFLASIFRNEKLNKGQWFAIWLSLSSCLILAYGHLMDLVYSMIIALSYAVYLVLQRNKFQMDKFFTLTTHIVVSTILLLPILSVIDSNQPRTSTFHWYIIVIAIFYTIIPLFLNNYALKKLDSSIVGTLLYLNPIISFLLAITYFKEPINLIQAMAFGLIFAAVIIFNVAYLKGKKLQQKEAIA